MANGIVNSKKEVNEYAVLFFCFEICVCKTYKNEIRRSRRYQRNTELTMTTTNSIVSSKSLLPTERKLKGRGDNIVEGKVVKAKIGEL